MSAINMGPSTDQNMPHQGMVRTIRNKGWRYVALVISLLGYAGAVSYHIQYLSYIADSKGCVDNHTLQYTAILMTGLLGGLALGPWVLKWSTSAIKALMPDTPDEIRYRRIKALSIAFILLGMAVDFLWIIPALNVFIDQHTPLLVEVDLILYLMGAIAGASWYIILDRQSWLGLLVTPAMALMIIGSVLAGHGWC
ncbi:hypothetical protein SAMN00768000_0373 [Sulfobacillus thermosulfidooxidans DSM 9293]|uniref:Uncharacterized protein n=1 Tax=Sulfobacillus thermosulfidooxidans (strain DSM 9293 / VKM B-1269 / AT-1) TaxID=929705 RepID=A0A1W1W7B3_SULTA|nr:hypothetical protein [Sulfobacillus thermosulfidooxidans]SMC02155.1 hypothetical protein SAMN00768000_0373 [Sulfobacillus thermosulfidooxidans DSM 9293]